MYRNKNRYNSNYNNNNKSNKNFNFSSDSIKLDKYKQICLYKTSPLYYKDSYNIQPIILRKCCNDCTPNSVNYYQPNAKHDYLINVLNLKQVAAINKDKTNVFVRRLLPDLAYISQIKHEKQLVLNKSDLLKSEGVIYAFENIYGGTKSIDNNKHLDSNDDLYDYKTLHNLFSRIYSNIKLTFTSNIFTNIVTYLTKKFCDICFRTIISSNLQLDSLRTAQKKNLPIIYLTTNKSILDMIIIKLCLTLCNLKVPQMFIEMNLVKFSFIFKMFNIMLYDKFMDANYNLLNEKVLYSYLKEALKSGSNICIYADSSIGNISLKQDSNLIMKIIVDLLLEENIYDATIVPVSLSYEKLYKTNGDGFQIVKKLKTLVKILFNIGKSGCVSVNFRQPFSLKEYINTNKSKTKRMKNSNLIANHLERHVLNDSFQNEAIMCTNMLAFIMMITHRNGCTRNTLKLEFKGLLNRIYQLNYKIGFSFTSINDVITHPLSLMNNLFKISSNGVIKPMIKTPNIYDLFDYTIEIRGIFFLESIIAYSIVLVLGKDLYSLNMSKNNFDVIKDHEIISVALRLLNIFKHNFPYRRPCQTNLFKIRETIDLFLQKDILVDPKILESTRNPKRSRKYMFDDDYEDDDYYYDYDYLQMRSYSQINFNENDDYVDDHEYEEINWDNAYHETKYYKICLKSNYIALNNLIEVLSPYVEGYYYILKYIQSLVDNQIYPNCKLEKMINSHCLKMLNSNIINKVESTSNVVQKSVFNYCLNEGIIEILNNDNTNYTHSYRIVPNNTLINTIELLKSCLIMMY